MELFVILATLAVLAREVSEHPYPYIGGIKAAKAVFEPVREYSSTGFPVDGPGQGEPILFASLVNANEVSEAGHGYDIRDEDRFWFNLDGDLQRLSKAETIPSDWHGELNTVGSYGENHTTPTAEMLDALGVPTAGPYIVTDERIHWPMFVKERRQNPNGTPADAYRKARWLAGKIEESGQIPVGFECKYEPAVNDQATKYDLKNTRWNAIAEGHLSEMRGLGLTSWESAREALAADRLRRREGQRRRFLKILDWIQTRPVPRVAKAFRWHRAPTKTGSFYQGLAKEKEKRAGKDDAYLTADQSVILSLAAAIRIGRKVTDNQQRLFQTACDSSPWEAWKATGKGKYEIEYKKQEENNPFDSAETFVDYEVG